MKNKRPQQADETERLNAFVDDLADLAADLHVAGKLQPRPSPTATDSTPRTVRRTKTVAPRKAPVTASGAAAAVRADAVVSAPHPERTRLLVLISAWWTIGQMELTGVSFDALIRAAVGHEPRAKALWDEFTERLHTLTVAGLERWPEAVLAPEVREFIEALVNKMGLSETPETPRAR